MCMTDEMNSNEWSDERFEDFVSSTQRMHASFDARKNKMKSESSEDNEESARQSQVVQLIEYIAGNSDITLFHDEQKNACLRLPVDSHFETWACESSSFRHWFSKSFYDSTGKVLTQNSLAGALQVIQGKAIFDGQEIQLGTRITRQGDDIWYDLADREWRAVRITTTGWKVESEVPIIFRRHSYQAPQVEPVSGGNIRDILKFVNIKRDDHQLLFLVTLCCLFVSDIPHPILYPHGPQGAAKTGLTKTIRRLIDPSRVEILSLPRNVEELKQQLAHYYFLAFDNVSYVSDEVSDLLCQAVTGSGFSKRRLYTDDDDVIRLIRANISINGISIAGTKPDFLERCVLIELERIEKEKRRQEHELAEELQSDLPKLLGSIFYVISRALAIKPTIKLKTSPRMADFATWGAAIAEAMGYSRDEFLSAYWRNINAQNDEVLSDNPTAVLVQAFMEDRQDWTGTATELLDLLGRIAGSNHLDPKDLPRSANKLSVELNRLKTSLEEGGFSIHKSEGTKRIITITKAPANTASIVMPQVTEVTPNDDTDDTFGTIGKIEQEDLPF